MVVGAILLLLALKEYARERRFTPAVKTRLIVVGLFAAVLAWLSFP